MNKPFAHSSNRQEYLAQPLEILDLTRCALPSSNPPTCTACTPHFLVAHAAHTGFWCPTTLSNTHTRLPVPVPGRCVHVLKESTPKHSSYTTRLPLLQRIQVPCPHGVAATEQTCPCQCLCLGAHSRSTALPPHTYTKHKDARTRTRTSPSTGTGTSTSTSTSTGWMRRESGGKQT